MDKKSNKKSKEQKHWGRSTKAGAPKKSIFTYCSCTLLLLTFLLVVAKPLLQAATINWAFTNPALYVYDAAKIIVSGTTAELRNVFPLVSDDTQAEFDAGTYTQSSWQTSKVAIDPSVMPHTKTLMNGLVGLWNLDETSGTSSYDYAGGYTGTHISSPTIVDSKSAGFGKAIDFAGNNYISVADTSALDMGTGDFSVAFWVNFDGATGLARRILAKFDGGTGWNLIHRSADDVEFITQETDNTNQTKCDTLATFTDGTWYHFVAVRQGTTVKVYVNGSTSTGCSATNTARNVTNAQVLSLGCYDAGGGFNNCLPGTLDEVALYNRALTDAEITALYTATRSFKISKNLPVEKEIPGMVSLWQLDEGSGQTAGDFNGVSTGTLGATSGSESSDPAWVTSGYRVGSGALRFDGSDDKVMLSDSASLSPGTGDCTVSAWIYSEDNTNPQYVFINQGASGANISLLNSSGSRFAFTVYDGTNSASATTPNNYYVTGRWYHMVGVKKATTAYLYINGALVASAANASLGSLTLGDGPVPHIGANAFGGSPFYGRIDNVSYFNRVLNEDEILALYRSRGQYQSTIGNAGAAAPTWQSARYTASVPYGRPFDRPPVHYWNFEQGTGTATDLIGSNHGTMTGGASWSDTVPSPLAFSDTKSIYMNGDDQYVALGTVSELSGASKISVSAWVKRTGSQDAGAILSRYTNTSDYFEICEGTSVAGGNDDFFIKIATGGTSAGSTYTTGNWLPLNTWTHMVFTFDGSLATDQRPKIYTNGILRAWSGSPSTVPSTLHSQSASTRVGDSVLTNANFIGNIDEVAIYDYVLRDDEIARLGIGAKKPYVPSDNYEKDLVGVWRLDNDGNDSTSISNGTENNMSYVPGIFGAAGSFNGSSSYINVPDVTDLNITTKLITVSAWIRTGTVSKSILSKGTTGSSGYEIAIDASGYAVFKKGGVSLTGTTVLTDFQWHHVLGTTNSSGNMFLYVDGAAENSNANTANFSTSSGVALKIGSNSANAYFNGIIDEATVFKAGVTASQALEIYKRGAERVKLQVRVDTDSGMGNDNDWTGGGTPDTGASSVWHFNHSSGTNVTDSAGSNTGTLSGSGYTWVSGKIGNAVTLGGATSDVVSVSPSAASQSTYTISLWYKTTGTSQKTLYSEGNTGNSTPQMYLTQNGSSSDIFFTHADDAGNFRSCSSSAGISNDGAWHHAAVVKESASVYKLYRDGISVSPCNGGGASVGTTTANAAKIGARQNGATVQDYFAGSIDEAVIYPRALSGTEVWKLYESGNFITRQDGEFLSALPKVQYVQYRTTFETLDEALSPDIQSVTLVASGVYPKDNPVITPSTAQSFNYVTSFAETATKPANTEIKYILTPNNGTDWYYHNGSNWVASNQTYAQANTASAINTNIASFDNQAYSDSKIPANSTGNFNWKAFLSSTNATATPQLTQVSSGVEAGTITVAYPNGSEVLKAGSAKPIYWTTTGTVPNDLTLEYSIDGLNYTSLSTTVSAATHNEEKISGAVGVWHLDGGTSGPITNGTTVGFGDSAGTNNGTASNGNASGMAWTTGKVTGSGAVSFDGTDDYVSVPHSASLSPTSAVTVMAWVKPTATRIHDYVDKGRDYHLFLNASNILAFEVTNLAGTTDSTGGSAVSTGSWSHIAGTFDGTTGKFAVYLNGALSGSKISSTVLDVRNSTSALTIGNGWFSGLISGSADDVAVFNRALSAQEIKAINDMGVNAGYVMTVPSILSNTVTVRARSASAVVITDVSNANFSITDLNIVAPNGAEQIRSNSTYTISWAGQANVPNDIILEYSTNSGSSFSAISGATGLNANGADTGVYTDPATLSGTVAVWHFDGGTSGSIANGTTTGLTDAAGGNNNGTAGNSNGTGMAWTTGKLSGAVQFDGVDDYISFSDTGLPTGTSARTIALWVKCVSCISTNYALFDYGTGNAGYIQVVSGGTVSWEGVTGVGTTTALTNGTWRHVAFSSDGTKQYAYVDGKMESSATVTLTTALVGTSTIGRLISGVWSFPGALDEIAVYNRALTAGEIAALAGRGYAWTVPDIGPGAGSSTVRVRARSSSATELTDDSDADFKVALLTITAPNGNESWTVGSSQNITWSKSTNLTDFKLEYSIDGGANWIGTPISASTGNVATFSWTIPDNVSSNTVVRACALTAGFTTICDTSDTSFTIPKVIVTAPNGTEQYQVGRTKFITWTESTGTPLDIVAEYSTDAPHSSWTAVSPAMNFKPTSIANHVGYWNFDETSGTTATDGSGSNNGTLAGGAKFAPGQFGNAIDFSANSAAKVTTSGLSAGSGARTWSLWANFSSQAASLSRFLLIDKAAGASLVNYAGSMTFTLTYNGSNTIQSSNYTTGVWHHVAGVYDGAGNASLYVDGQLIGSRSDWGVQTMGTGPGIGNTSAGGQNFPGLIDEVAIYNRALTAGEIAKLALGPSVLGKGPDVANVSGATSNWHFDGATYGGIANGVTAGLTDSIGTVHGTANNADAAGMQWAPGLFSGAVKLDGVDDYILTGNLPTVGSGDFTFGCWMNANTIAKNQYFFSRTQAPAHVRFNITTAFSNGNVFFGLQDSGSVAMSASTTTPVFTTNTWYHVAGIKRGTGVEVYVNGALAASSSNGSFGAMTLTASPGYIGNDFGGGGNFDGFIDEAVYYTKALTPVEVAVLAGKAAYQWTIPDVPSTTVKVRVKSSSVTALSDDSDADFKIAKMQVTNPNSANYMKTNASHGVNWTTPNGIPGNIKTEKSVDAGLNWTTVSAATSNDGDDQTGTYGSTPSKSVLWRVSGADAGYTQFEDQSDGVSSLIALDLAAPNGSDQFQVGATQYITWATQSSNAPLDLIAEYSTDSGHSSWSAVSPAMNFKPTAIANHVGYWNFDETSGVTATDRSSTNNGTLTNGAKFVPGQFGNAVQLDGVDDYVDLGNVLNAPATFSISAWVNPAVLNGNQGIVTRWNGTGYLLSLNSSNKFTLQIDSSGSFPVSLAVPTAGVWVHVAGTYDGTNARLYVNGVLQDTQPHTAPTSNAQNLVIGRTNGIQYLKGKIDEVTVYNRALTDTEVAQLAIPPSILGKSPDPANLSGSVAIWHLDGAALGHIANGLTSGLEDAIGANNSGTANNADGSGMAWAVGKMANAVTFDGVDDYITGSDAGLPSGNSDRSVSLWFKSTLSSGTGVKRIFGYGVTPNDFFLTTTGNEFICVQDGSNSTCNSTDVLNQSWHHVAAILRSGVVELYVDGSLANSASRVLATTLSSFMIGLSPNHNTGYCYPGALDEVAVYNRALSANEIAQLAGLAAYEWTVPDASSSTVKVRLRSSAQANLTDDSDANFAIEKINVTAPNGAEFWPIGTAQNITWQTGSVAANVKIEYTTNGTTFSPVLESEGTADDGIVANDGSFTWTIPNSLTQLLKIRVTGDTASYNKITDISDNYASIIDLDVTYPNGSEQFQVGATKYISWTGSTGAPLDLVAEYSIDAGHSTWNAVSPAMNLKPTSISNHAGYWNFNETSGTTAADSSSTNNGTLTNGAKFAPGQFGNAVLFDGVNDYVSMADSANLSPGAGDFTISTWIYGTRAGTNTIWENTGASTNNSASLETTAASGQKARITFRDGSANQAQVTGVTALSLNTWYHLAGVRRGTTAELYVNGTLEGTNTNASLGTITVSDGTVPHMGESYIGTNFMGGLIDEPAIYSRALTAGEIAKLALSPSALGKAPDPVNVSGATAIWHLDGGTSGSIAQGTTAGLEDAVGSLEGTATNDDGTGMLWVPGPMGGAVQFDGIDDVIGVGNESIVVGQPYSISAWVFLDQANETGYVLGRATSCLSLVLHNGAPRFSLTTGTFTGSALSLNQWYHLAAVFDGTTGYLYVNGVLAASNAGTTSTLTQPVYIGDLSLSSTSPFKGKIDEVATFRNKALTGPEILVLAGKASYAWTIPDAPSSTVKVRIRSSSVTDLTDASDANFIIEKLAITYPNGGELWPEGAPRNITWSTGSSVANVKLEYTTDGTNFTQIIGSTTNNGTLSWSPPIGALGTAVKIRITGADGGTTSFTDMSDANFSVIDANITSQNSTQRYIQGKSTNITWTGSAGTPADLILEYVADGTFDGDQVEIANSLPASGSQSWTIPVILDNRVRIRLRSSSVSDLNDTNDAAIIVSRLAITSPNGANTLRMGATGINITWDALEYAGGDLPSDFVLEYSTDAPHSTWTQVTGATSIDAVGTTTYNWNPIPSFGSVQSTVQVRLRSSGTAAWSDDSNANFTIDFPTLTFTAPTLNQVVPFGSNLNITWTHDGTTQGSLSTDLKIEYSEDNGSTWPGGAQVIVAGSAENGGPVVSPFQWGVPAEAVSNTVKIRITDNQSTTTQVSTPVFKVTGSMTMQSPTGNEKWAAGFPHNIQWLRQGSIANVDIILYDTDPNNPLVTITSGEPNTGSYSWTPAYSDAHTNVKIRVSDSTDSTVYTESPAAFTVSSISLGNPSARLLAGSAPNVIWSSAGITNVKLEYSLLGDFSDAQTAAGCSSVPAGNLQCAVTIPQNTVGTFRVRGVDADLPSVGDQDLAFDESDSDATIYGNLTVTAPNGGESLSSGNPTNITWTTSPANVNVIANVKVQVAKNGNFNDNTGGNIITLTSSTPNHNVATGSGSYSWTPTFTSSTSRVRVMDADAPSPVAGQDRDDSNGTFAVAGIAISSPAGGETALVNSTFNITFEYAGTTVSHVDIDYSPDGGTTWNPVVNNFNLPSNPYTYAGWTVPNDISTNAKVRVRDHDSPAVLAISTGVFSIKGTLSINTPPDQIINDGYTIQWTNTGSIADVKLEYSPSGNFSGDEVTITTLTGLSGAQTPTNQSHLWTVPNVLKTTIKLRVTDMTTRANGSPATSSTSGVFSIHPIIVITSPISSSVWAVNETTRNITWGTTGTVPNLKIEYVPVEGTQSGTASAISPSTANTNSYNWPTIPDIVTLGGQNPNADGNSDGSADGDRDIMVKIRITDDGTLNAGHPTTVVESDPFKVEWYQTEWRIKDVDSSALIQGFSVTDNSGWSVSGDSLTQVTNIIRNYKYGTYTTTFSKTGYAATTDDGWIADQDQTRIAYLQNDATASVEISVKVQYNYDLATDTFQFIWWIERGGILQTNANLLFSGRIEVYENGSGAILTTLNDGDGADTKGIYEVSWPSSGIDTTKLYFAKGIIAYGNANSFKTSGITIDVRDKVASQQISAGVSAIQTSTAAINTKIGDTSDTEAADTLFGKVQKLNSALGEVTDAAGTDSVFGKIADQTENQVTILDEVQNKLPDLIKQNSGGAVKGGKGRMLQRTAKAYLGDTAEISFQFDSGATPTVDIYSPQNVQLVSAGSMTEVNGTGIYNYNFKIPATYTAGEYTVIVKESSNGFMDSMILEVLSPTVKDERMSAAVVNAQSAAQSASSDAKRIWQEVMGIKGLLGSGTVSLGDQMGQVASLMSSLKGSISVLTGDAAGGAAQPVTISTVHDTLMDVMGEVRAVAGRQGINMDAVYSSVAAQAKTAKEIQNMVIATEAAAKTSQDLLEKAQDKPVMTTWFENPKAA